MSIKITKQNFSQEVLASDKPVLVDFWAPWCGPCRMVGPVIDELATELDGKVKVGKINVDEEGELAQAYQVFSIPTLIVFEGGKVKAKTVGFSGKEAIKRMLGA